LKEYSHHLQLLPRLLPSLRQLSELSREEPEAPPESTEPGQTIDVSLTQSEAAITCKKSWVMNTRQSGERTNLLYCELSSYRPGLPAFTYTPQSLSRLPLLAPDCHPGFASGANITHQIRATTTLIATMAHRTGAPPLEISFVIRRLGSHFFQSFE
jgi:hypothetical protein